MRDHRRGSNPSSSSSEGSRAVAPGKRSLTSQIPVLRKSAGDAEVSRAAAEAQVDRASRSPGSGLPDPLRRDLESSLGRDLSSVRVHTGGESASSADALQARAYAVGQDVHFGAGAYDPSSSSGKHLIAHEVAHTVQQSGSSGAVQRSGLVSRPGDAAEVEADRFADTFTSGGACQGIVTAGAQLSAEIHCYDRDEHRDIPTRHLLELEKFLATPEGEKWAKDHGHDAKVLRGRMKSDPVVKGEELHGPGNKARPSRTARSPLSWATSTPGGRSWARPRRRRRRDSWRRRRPANTRSCRAASTSSWPRTTTTTSPGKI